MIATLLIENFRGFEHHTVPLRDLAILVGKNNAGKSTIVEALRLVSLITSRYQSLNYCVLPPWLDRPKRDRAVYPSTEGIEFNSVGAFHRYGNPPARLLASFSTGEEVEVLIGPEMEILGIIKGSDGNVIRSKGQARQLSLPEVAILPQIGPLLREEPQRDQSYVRQSMLTSRASLHFRNQLVILNSHFPSFKNVAEETWPGLVVSELNIARRSPTEAIVTLLIRDMDFIAEVGWMGHGLQMWLQTMWFLTHAASASTIILDEPDVYMHADLQRRLIRLLRSRAHQTIVATHSVEIMAEVEPDEIMVIDKKRRRSFFAGKQETVQKLLENVGTIHNIQLARLSSARRFLMVEGDDVDFLKRFQNTVLPRSNMPIDTIPHKSIGGWDGWERAIGSAAILTSSAAGAIKSYCLLDSDYHTPKALADRKKSAKANGINLHIWARKEIENYLLVPAAIRRLMERGAKRDTVPSEEEIEKELIKIASGLRDTVFNGMAAEFDKEDRSLRITGANRAASDRLKPLWKSKVKRLELVSGKTLIGQISAWSKAKCNVSFSATKLANEISAVEIADEVKTVLTAIENREDF